MNVLQRFWRQPSAKYRNFQLAFLFLTLNFCIPAATYVVAPEVAQENMLRANELLGGVAYTFPEAGSRVWRYLGAANVMTLGLMCLLLQVNLRYFRPTLLPLCFLKGYNATLFLAGFLANTGFRGFLVVALYDYLNTWMFWYFARGAHRDIRDRPDAELVPAPLAFTP